MTKILILTGPLTLSGKKTAEKARDLSLAIYNDARNYASSRGIIICDTKFEFGFYEGELILIDEVLTPDSSRFWPADSYEAGRAQQSFDKQYVRDHLETLDWNKDYPGPKLPREVIEATSERYLEAYRILTGNEPPLLVCDCSAQDRRRSSGNGGQASWGIPALQSFSIIRDLIE